MRYELLNTTESGAVDVTWAWGTANAANTITSEIAYIEVIKLMKTILLILLSLRLSAQQGFNELLG